VWCCSAWHQKGKPRPQQRWSRPGNRQGDGQVLELKPRSWGPQHCSA
jgi:hypothetical protein